MSFKSVAFFLALSCLAGQSLLAEPPNFYLETQGKRIPVQYAKTLAALDNVIQNRGKFAWALPSRVIFLSEGKIAAIGQYRNREGIAFSVAKDFNIETRTDSAIFIVTEGEPANLVLGQKARLVLGNR